MRAASDGRAVKGHTGFISHEESRLDYFDAGVVSPNLALISRRARRRMSVLLWYPKVKSSGLSPARLVSRSPFAPSTR